MTVFEEVIDPYGLLSQKDIQRAELRLTALKQELACKWDAVTKADKYTSTGLGGDPFFYIMMSQDPHVAVCDGRISTAATSGEKYYWNPFFIDCFSQVGLRYILAHEITHTVSHHVPKMKNRHKSIHNKCADYFANNLPLSDLKMRWESSMPIQKGQFKDYFEFYKDAMCCDDPITIDEERAYMLDPVGHSYGGPKAETNIKMMIEYGVIPSAMERENTIKCINLLRDDVKNKRVRFYFDREIPETCKTPEALYDDLTKSLKKCDNCGRVGMFPIPEDVRENARSIFEQVKHKYPSSDDLLDLLCSILKKHNVELPSGEIIPDAELIDERRFLNTIDEKKIGNGGGELSSAMPDNTGHIDEEEDKEEDKKEEDKAHVCSCSISKDSPADIAMNEFFKEAQDLYYAAIKESVFFDAAKIDDQQIKEGRAVIKYNKGFIESLGGFVSYVYSELASIEKNRPIEDIFEVLKKSINNTLAGFYLIQAKLRGKIKTIGEDGENTASGTTRIYQDTEQMFNCLKKNRYSILDMFNLWGGYSKYIDTHINPDWANTDALDCPHCAHKIDIFHFNENKAVQHLDAEEGEGEGEEEEESDGNGDGGSKSKKKGKKSKGLSEAIAKNKLMQALMYAKSQGFKPAGYEEAIGALFKPKMRWQTVLTTKRRQVEGNGRNDWNRLKSKQLACYMMVPKKTERIFHVNVLCDTSGSMDMVNDITFGISQLQSLTGGAGILTWADAEIYWNESILLKKFNKETLKGLQTKGRGGTDFLQYFNEYEKKLQRFQVPKPDLIVVITDGYLYEKMDDIRAPKCPVMWLITNHGEFKPKFGKVFNIHND